MRRKEPWRVYGALLCAAGKCLYDRFKLVPGLLSPSMGPLLRSSKRVSTNNPNKRKPSTDLSATQPPLKKIATDATANSMASASMGENMKDAGLVLSSRQMVESIPSAATRSDQGSALSQRVSAVLRQAWKKDQDTGHLLGSLYEVFGEAIFSFVQAPKMSLFV